jgi:3-hydroxyisobutyrate dehydrogenase-like beta-hydroxyacid dehydrogenase
MANVGIIGLGEMGRAITERLLKGGHQVAGWNRTRERAKPLEAEGMKVASAPREVAERSELTIVMVTDTRALQSVIDGPDGALAGLKSGKVLADMGTTSPLYMNDLGARVSERGAQLLDTPVLGSAQTVREGRATIVAGGDRNAFEKVKPMLQSIGEDVRYVGALGQAKTLKLAANLNLAVQLVGLFEGVLLAEKEGIDRRAALDELLGGVIASPHMKYRAPFIVDPPDHAWFDCNMMQKDLELALALAHEKEIAMPATALADQLLNSARALGWAEEDFAVLFHVLAALSGIERPAESIPAYARR